MERQAIITLSTDFGYSDPLSGIMKGVILSVNPHATVVDITHGINPYDIRGAALAIGMSFKYFPPSTIHIVVTDPDVGSQRRPVLVTTEDYYFVGPDNGVFSLVYRESERCEVRHITAGHYFMHNISATFHGRDIFAPVAGWMSRDIRPDKFGDVITDYRKLSFPLPVFKDGKIVTGEIIAIDHFGNAITNIRKSDMELLMQHNPGLPVSLMTKGITVPMRKYYAQAGQGLSALINSIEHIELFTYCGNASEQFHLKAGDPVELGCVTIPSKENRPQ